MELSRLVFNIDNNPSQKPAAIGDHVSQDAELRTSVHCMGSICLQDQLEISNIGTSGCFLFKAG